MTKPTLGDLVSLLLAGMAFGIMLTATLQRAFGKHRAALEAERQRRRIYEAERRGFDLGYASALGVRASIEEPPPGVAERSR